MIVRQEKVVSRPPELDKVEPNTLYYVRVGTGFDLYLSDMTGDLLFKLNSGDDPNTKLQNYLKGRKAYE